MTLVHFAFASALAFFAPTRTSLLGQPVRPRSALLLQLDDSAPATNEEVRMARMYKPGDEKDPLKKPRPKFGLAPATGRPTEKVCAADMPTTADLPEWAEHLRESGVERLLFVHEGAADDEHVALLMLQGFAADAVTAVDVSAEGAAQQTAQALQAAASKGVKVCVHGGPALDDDRGLRSWDGTACDERGLAEYVRPWLRRFFPAVDASAPLRTEGCLYSNTPDHDFVIDTLPGQPRFVVGAGFSGHGFKLAPVVGHMLAQLALAEGSAAAGPGAPLPPAMASGAANDAKDGGAQQQQQHDGSRATIDRATEKWLGAEGPFSITRPSLSQANGRL